MPIGGVRKISHAEILTLEEVERVARVFGRLGIKKIRLTGGEPLLRKNLPSLVVALKRLSGIEQVTLTTNGVLLRTSAPELLAAGLDGLNLSLDTLDEKIFTALTRRNLLPTILDGLSTLLAQGLQVKLNCVPLRGVNETSLLDLARLAKDNPIAVRFIELMPIGCAFESGLRGIPSAELFATLEQTFGELIPVKTRNALQGPAQYFKPKGFIGTIGFIDALEHKFCGTCNRIRLTSSGFLKTCLSHEAGLDVKQLLRSGVDDSELSERIHETIYRKPREHQFGGATAFQMYQVGG